MGGSFFAQIFLFFGRFFWDRFRNFLNGFSPYFRVACFGRIHAAVMCDARVRIWAQIMAYYITGIANVQAGVGVKNDVNLYCGVHKNSKKTL